MQILELLHEQSHDQKTAVLVVTHNREIARVAHRVIELSSDVSSIRRSTAAAKSRSPFPINAPT